MGFFDWWTAIPLSAKLKLMKNMSLLLFFSLLLLSLAFSASASAPLDVVINEIAWMGTKNSPHDEWIELYNNTTKDINLGGWGLYEAGGKILIEPLTGIIEAKSYYLIERTDDATVPGIPASQEPSGWGGRGLKNSGEHLQLKDNNGVVIDEIRYLSGWFAGDNKTKQTMERKDSLLLGNEEGNWQNSQEPGGTPKAKNSSAQELLLIQEMEQALPSPAKEEPLPQKIPQNKQTVENSSLPFPEKREKTIKEYPSGVVINEILPSPEGPDAEEEWIELFNQNNFEVDISGWQLSDSVGGTKNFTFSEGATIKAKGFAVLFRPTTKITLNNGGDGLKLVLPNGVIIDSLDYSKAARAQSFNRLGSQWLWSPTLTPGKENIIPEPKETKERSPEVRGQQKEPFSEKEKGLAAVSQIFEQKQERYLPKSSNFLLILLIGIVIAVFSGVMILILKKKIGKNKNLS
jgi:hypothetical protein